MRKTFLGGVALVAFAALILGAGTAASAPVPGTDVLYTLDADFDQGTLTNVNHDAPNNDQLQLNESTSTFPFIWIALSQRCTIAKINTETGVILGEYRTISDSAGCNQSSRTTVAIDGSVWVGHRGPGGVTHVGQSELNQCIDRNGDSVIQTSTGYGDVLAWPGVDSDAVNAADECIIHHVDTNAVGLFDSRHMSIDASNNLWVGDFAGGGNFVRINGATGTVASPVKDTPCGGYGGLIDGNGVIWSAQGSLLRWDPNAPDSGSNPACVNAGHGVYGVAIDSNGFIWTSSLFGGTVSKLSNDGTSFSLFPQGNPNAQGLAVDSDGDVWISSSLFCGSGCQVAHLKNDGTFVGFVDNPSGAGSTGVAVDAAGKIWTANLNANTATRIDPNAGLLGCGGTGCGDGTRVGAVDLVVDFPATPGRPLPYPYNYSDMTGAQLFSSTAPQGTWTVTQDGGAAGTAWSRITWNTEPEGSVPAGTALTVEARAADSEAGLGSETYVAVSNDVPFTMTGRFIQVRVTFEPDDESDASPVLSDIRIQAEPQDADISVTKSDDADPRSFGSGNVTYTIDVANAGPADATNVAVSDTLTGPGTITGVWPASCSFTATTVSCAYGSIAAGDSETITVTVTPSGPGTLSDTVTAFADEEDPDESDNTDTETTQVVDTTKPTAGCIQGPNPAGNIPSAGNNPKSGQNPDGYYTLVASDDVGVATIVVRDSGSSFVSLPFQSGDHIKLTQAPGVTPSDTRPGPGVITSLLKLKGDAIVVVTDTSGNVSETSCKVAPKPK